LGTRFSAGKRLGTHENRHPDAKVYQMAADFLVADFDPR
jgi:hypothetical protein